MHNYFFSIVIPVFQAERYLKECLESILHQDEEDWELILVDDGSTDSSPAICDAYQSMDPRIQVIHKKNEGPIPARICGYAVCSGNYVVSVDADDILEQQALSVFRSALSEEDADILLFNYSKIDSKGKFRQKGSSLPNVSFTMNNQDVLIHFLLQQKVLNNLWTKVIKREILQAHLPIDESLLNVRSGEDLVIVTPILLAAQKIISIQDVLYLYRMVPGSITHSFQNSRIDDLILSRSYFLSQLEGAGLLSDLLKADVYRSIYETACYLLWNCGRSNASYKEKMAFFKYMESQTLYRESLSYGHGIFPLKRKRFSLWMFEHKKYCSFILFEQIQKLAKIRGNFCI